MAFMLHNCRLANACGGERKKRSVSLANRVHCMREQGAHTRPRAPQRDTCTQLHTLHACGRNQLAAGFSHSPPVEILCIPQALVGNPLPGRWGGKKNARKQAPLLGRRSEHIRKYASLHMGCAKTGVARPPPPGQNHASDLALCKGMLRKKGGRAVAAPTTWPRLLVARLRPCTRILRGWTGLGRPGLRRSRTSSCGRKRPATIAPDNATSAAP